ncbi:MAG TPA: D-tyrosyl-tRNA(Tyr) deacylase [Flavobacteriales bacterium]|nr:D-tyrosyl-tRNA(Tyr) deacylase [Flavobacteriales bacterium]
MRLLIQRVARASVRVEEQVVGAIGQGLLLLVGVEQGDNEGDATWLAEKVSKLRIFSDSDGKMNASVLDVQGELLVVSQFTLHASYKKGTRPSFVKAAHPDHAIPMYEAFVAACETAIGKPVSTGQFGAAMAVDLINDGPVTIWMDTQNKE